MRSVQKAKVRFPPIAEINVAGENPHMHLPKVFFDTNNGSFEGGYWLGLDQSRRELEALGAGLYEGRAVTLYMPDELELTATLRFDATEKIWWADPISTTTSNGSA